jgi:molybdate transport system substrate-binding protein
MMVNRLSVFLAVLVAGVAVVPAEAAELTVLSAGAVRSIVSDLTQAFERESGHTVKISYAPVGVIRQKLGAGEKADVVIVTDAAVDDMARQGAVVMGSRTDVGRTGMGVAVREGAARPDVSTPEALKQTLLAAKSIVYVDPAQGATSGIHFASVLQRLGIADAVKPKTTLVPGGYPAELVAKGEVELVAHQISEIVPVKGVTLVGPLPKDLQKLTVYSAGVVAQSDAPTVARDYIKYLTRPDLKPKFAQAGLDYRE